MLRIYEELGKKCYIVYIRNYLNRKWIMYLYVNYLNFYFVYIYMFLRRKNWYMKCNDFKCYVIYLINDEFKYIEENV